MAEQISNGRGTQYPKFSRITDILGTTNLDKSIEDIYNEFKEGTSNKNGEALINAIIDTLKLFGLSTDITLGQLLYCPNYECATIYFKILDDILEVNDIFFRMYKPLTDAQVLYGGAIFKSYDNVYFRK
jgi:hypothetical protein